MFAINYGSWSGVSCRSTRTEKIKHSRCLCPMKDMYDKANIAFIRVWFGLLGFILKDRGREL